MIIVLVGILPLYLKISNQVEENNKLKYQIKTQKDLGPVYQTLVNSDKNKKVLALPHPDKTALSRIEAQTFQKDFYHAAQQSGLKVVLFTPDINTSISPSTSFSHNISLKGEWADFRRMLIALGAIPYLDRIEEIHIQQGTNAMEFKMKVWIGIK